MYIGSVFRYNKGTQDCEGGNTWFYYTNCPKLDIATSFVIDSSKFLFGYQPYVQLRSLSSGGLNFAINCTNVHVNATNLRLYGNKGYFGGNAHFYFMLFTSISIAIENSYLGAGQASRGAGALVFIGEDTAVNDKDSCSHHSLHFQNHHQLMYFSNVTFQENAAQNSGAGFQIEDRMEPGHWCANQLVVIENCHFIGNTINDSWVGGGAAARFSSAALSQLVYPSCMKRNIQIQFRNTTFENNTIHSYESYPRVFESTLSIESYVNVTFVNCTFIGNQGSAIYAFQTDIIFQGNNTFHNNSGKLGAGLSLFVNSFLYLKPHTNLLFSNNKAQYFGGAIFTDLEVEIPGTVLPCFFQVLKEGLEEQTAVSSIHVEFVNNTAKTAGSSLYGGYLNDCQGLGLPVSGFDVFKKIFH